MTISGVVIAKNEEKMIADCLSSLDWCDEVLVIDNGSTDSTAVLAKKAGAQVVRYTKGSYSEARNEGLRQAKGDWLVYIDADERVTPLLRQEILAIVTVPKYKLDKSAYAIPRRNIILGREMHYGGWWPDYVKRLYVRKCLKTWSGEIHENPDFEGELGHLDNPMVHLKHDNLHDMIEKSNVWSEKEALLLYQTNHPKMVPWRFGRIFLTELFYRLVKLQGFRDGLEGVIYAFYQAFYRFMVYAKLWELQLGKLNIKN